MSFDPIATQTVRVAEHLEPAFHHAQQVEAAKAKLADHMKVTAAKLDNGLLAIDIVREIPEELKPRRISIGSGDAPEVSKQIVQETERPRKVA